MSTDRALRRFALIERSDGGGADIHESRWTWAIARRVLGALHGASQVAPDVLALAGRPRPHRTWDELALAPGVRAALEHALTQSGALVVVAGMPGLGRRTVLAAAATAAGHSVLDVDARRLARDPVTLARQLRCIVRECLLLARTPLVANIDALAHDGSAPLLEILEGCLSAVDGPVLATYGTLKPRLDWTRPIVTVELGPLTGDQRVQVWQHALGRDAAVPADALARRLALAPALIHQSARAARATSDGAPLSFEDVAAGVRSVLDGRMGELARRVNTTQTWDDVVLSPDHLTELIDFMSRIRGRQRVYEHWGFAEKVGKGLGVSALFSGPPGTGKTMVAALIARELGLELYQVDLSKVVSKWIGESEKHLAALFDAAEAGHAILLFDEADALFGKRTDVKSSNDRYANLETNYLLQRLESFTGTCLLTSNHEGNIDPAFQRRLSLHLRFELPDEAERSDLWHAMLPTAAPVVAPIDFESLGRRYSMSGGYIRNAVLRAAFMAANDSRPICGADLERAALLKWNGMGRLAVGG